MPQDDLDEIANALNRKLEKNANNEARWKLAGQQKRTEADELQDLAPAELTKFVSVFRDKVAALKEKVSVPDDAYSESLKPDSGYIGWSGIQFLRYEFEKMSKTDMPAFLHIWVKRDATKTDGTGAYRCKPIFKIVEGGVRKFYWKEITYETTFTSEELATACFTKLAKAIIAP